MAMRPDSKASQVLATVGESAVTTAEVAALLGWSLQLANAHLQQLLLRGKIDREPFTRESGPHGGPCRVWLWKALPGKGVH